MTTGTDEFIYKRSFSDQNINKFKQALTNIDKSVIDWNTVLYPINDPKEAYSTFHSSITKLHNKCFPMKKIRKGYKTRKSWLTEDLKKYISVKNKLYAKSSNDLSGSYTLKYLEYKSKLNLELRKAERKHYEDPFNLYQNDLSRSWQKMSVIDHIELNNEIITDKKIIVNSFNDFYINIGPNISKSTPDCDVSPLAYMGTRVNNSMFINPTIETEIRKIILSLKNSSPGWDEITGKILKETYNSILQPLTYVFNLSLSHGVVPSELKVAKVIPLYKGDSKFIISNYRPVSILPVFF